MMGDIGRAQVQYSTLHRCGDDKPFSFVNPEYEHRKYRTLSL